MSRRKREHRWKAAWGSFVCIQVFWAMLVVLTPIAISLHPSKLWALPFACVTMAGGMHLTFFRREYHRLVEKFTAIFPTARYFFAPVHRPKYYLPLGVAYTLFGAGCAIAIAFY
ncbi:MAG: hypothetical protein ACRDSJ_19475 [Rubrobacteraceae bacterium]